MKNWDENPIDKQELTNARKKYGGKITGGITGHITTLPFLQIKKKFILLPTIDNFVYPTFFLPLYF